METWFLNHVLGLSAAVLLLALPGPLGAGTPTSNGTSAATEGGFYHSAATEEAGNLGNNATSTSYSSESLSPSQRSLLLSHAATAANLDTEQTQASTETSSRSIEATSQSTEPLTSTVVPSSETSSSSSGFSSSSNLSSSGSSSSSSGFSSSSSSDLSSSSSSGFSSSSDLSSGGSSISSSSSSSISSSSSSSSTSSSSSSSISSSSSSTSSSSSGFSSSSGSSISTSSSGSSSSSSSRLWIFTEELPQDSPGTTLRLRDATALSSQTSVLTDSTYTTTISRAGERTLLSVTSSSSSSSSSSTSSTSSSSSSSSSNSTSSAFTEGSDSHHPPSTGSFPPQATETEEYTHSAPSTRADGGETSEQHMTTSFQGTSTESGSPAWSRDTPSMSEPPNATQHQHTSASEETSESTPPLRLTEPSTDLSEVSVSSSTPPFTSPAGGGGNDSGTDQSFSSSVGSSTEPFTGPQSSSTQEGTEGLFYHPGEDRRGFGLTAAPSTVSSSTSETDDALTVIPAGVPEAFLSTSPVPVTERPHLTEEDTFETTDFTTTAATTLLPLLVTSSSSLSSTSSRPTVGAPIESTVPYATSSPTPSILLMQTSTVQPTHPASPSQSQGPSTRMATPTRPTTLQTETSTGAERLTTAHSQYMTTADAHAATTESAEVQDPPVKQTEGGTAEQMVTTVPTDVQLPKLPPTSRNPCVSNPCVNGGMCVSYKRHQFVCHCQQAWTGPTCSQDVNECEQDPCPVGSRCVNTQGSFSCECPLGFDLEDGRTCTRAKTFLGTFSVNRLPHDSSSFKTATVHEIQREILQLLNMSLSVLRGYSRSTLSKKEESGVHILAVNMFTVSADVTTAEVYNSIQMSLGNCSASLTHCRMVLHHQLTYHAESLCVAQKTQCDVERSTCRDSSGTAHCQCLPGYYKHNPDDLSCLECGDGFKLENGTCVPCMFGFGGFNCGNFYKLIAVVVSPAGGALLLVLIIALIVTCCKRDKNDINKIIFKSGDLQMSPYADFPKNNRISMEWGRETIEMQENGSTKNLLQMTDIYYSPALRNSDLERNGLYPFTGLPGSRHSCIYPAQWNPSFISDDSRRRDYF